jgi:hypothetical protein
VQERAEVDLNLLVRGCLSCDYKNVKPVLQDEVLDNGGLRREERLQIDEAVRLNGQEGSQPDFRYSARKTRKLEVIQELTI